MDKIYFQWEEFMYGMIEWKRYPRSLRFENAEVICDVWPFMYEVKKYIYNVCDAKTGVYIATGIELTEDEACEAALKMAKI